MTFCLCEPLKVLDFTTNKKMVGIIKTELAGMLARSGQKNQEQE